MGSSACDRERLAARSEGRGRLWLRLTAVAGPVASMVAAFSLSLVALAGASFAEEELFEKDIGKKKELIENDFHQIADLLSANEIGKTRDIIQLIEHRLDGIKKDIPKQERENYDVRLDRVVGVIDHKEDSLVNRNLEILKKDGMDAAIDFQRGTLRRLRVSDDKIKEVDEAIVAAAPLQKTADEKAFDKARELVGRGVKPEQMDDELVRAAAQRILRHRADSLQAIQDSIRAAEEEAARLERLRQERLEAERRQRELEEQRQQEERLAKLEKARIDSMARAKKEMERDRKRLEKQREKRDKERLDSLKLAQREEERRFKEEKKQKEALAQEREQAIRDSAIAEAQREKARLDELERKRLERQREEERGRQELATQQEAERRRAAAQRAERERQIRLEEGQRLQQERAEAERRAQLERERLASAERERQERIRMQEADRRQREQMQREAEERRLTAEQAQRERQAAMEEEQRRQAFEVERERQAQYAAQQREAEEAERDRRAQLTAQEREAQRAERERQAQLEAQRREEERLAREQERGERERREAEEEARRRREAATKVASISAPPAYAAAAPAASARRAKAPSSAAGYAAEQDKPDRYEAKAQQYVVEIYGLLEQNRIEDAYRGFQRTRDEISKHASPEVYSTLEMTVMEAYIEAKKQKEIAQATPTGAPQYDTYMPKASSGETNARRQAARIEGLLRRNNVQAAYDTFKRVRNDLRKNLDRTEYKQLEEKIENAYKYYKQ